MFATMKQAAAVGAAIAGVGWLTVVSPVAAHAQPPRMPQGNNFTCPEIAGINYVPDPEDSNGYYLCVDGSPQDQRRCPQVTKLIMQTPGMPPKCMPFPHVMP